MKLFDRFLKKPATADQHAPMQELSEDRNFVDDLVGYFRSKPEVNAAYFGFACHDATKQYHLFLAVDHHGDAENISNLTGFIKSVHMKDTLIHYASPTHNSDMLEYIRQHNLPFYLKDDPALLQRKIMKQWFDVDKYTQELIDTLRDSTVVSLLFKPGKTDDPVTFATYIRDSGEFIPLFSNEHMIAKSGMTEIPDNRLVTTLPFRVILEMFDEKRFFVLNPGTPFEVELRV